MIQKSLLKIVPLRHQRKTIRAVSQTNNLLSRYFIGILIQITIIFIFYSIGLLIAGVENAFIIAFICSLFNVIPYIGPLIGGSIMLLLTITSNLDMGFKEIFTSKAGYVLGAFVIGQLVDNFFSQPLIFSNTMKSHPLEIFLVIVGAGLLAGVPGMIVAVPLYTILKITLREFAKGNKMVQEFTKGLEKDD